jgi:hypothetical protein
MHPIDLPIFMVTVLNKIVVKSNADILHDSIEMYLLAHTDETNLHAHDKKQESATKS